MADIDEIAPDIFRLSIHVPQFDLQFNHFLVRDEEPLLFHTGMRGMFPAGPRCRGARHRSGLAAVDQLEPLRGGRMRRAQRVALGSATRTGSVRRGRRDGQRRRTSRSVRPVH